MSIDTSAPSDQNTAQCRYVKYQYLAVCVVNILSLCHGSTIGWMSPAIRELKANHTASSSSGGGSFASTSPLISGPATVAELSWIGAYFSVGGLIGNLLFAVVLRYAGLRRTMYMLVVPNMLFWLSVLLGRLPWHLYIGRVSAGLTGGGLYLCVPMFVSDVADKKIRGALGSYLMVFVSFGILVSFIAGTYLRYAHVPYVFIFLPLFYVAGLFCMPDTCPQLLARQRRQAAERAFIFYSLGNRRLEADAEGGAAQQKHVADEMDKLELYLKTRASANASLKVWEMICSRAAIKGIATGLCLTALNLFSGTLCMLSYTSLVFEQSGSTIDADLSTIIIGCVQVVSVYASSHLVDRLGRKTLLIASCAGAALASAGLGGFSYAHKNTSADLSGLNWLPLAMVSFYIVITCMGLLPLPFIILAEILPAEVRQVGSTVCMISISVFAFVSLKAFPLVVAAWGLWAAMAICALVCVLGVVFGVFVLRETKGKDLHAVAEK